MSSADQALAEARAECARLRATIRQKDLEILRLTQWLQSLQQDIFAVYRSITWLMGDRITKVILWLMRRPVGPTAEDHIRKLMAEFEAWKLRYFAQPDGATHEPAPYMPWHGRDEYQPWIDAFDTPSKEALQRQRAACTDGNGPGLEWILPVDEDPEGCRATLAALEAQTHPRWRAVLVGQHPPEWLQAWLRGHPEQGLWVERPADQPAEVAGFAACQGEWFGFLAPGDLLPPHALYTLSEYLRAHPQVAWVYSDSDSLDAEGQRSDPYFKPDWNPDLFHSQFYCRDLALYRREKVIAVGGVVAARSIRYDLALRLARESQEKHIGHVARVLIHTAAFSTGEDTEAAELATLRADFARHQPALTVESLPGGNRWVRYPLPDPLPLVSVLMPTRDKLDLLRGTVQGVLAQTDYPALELIVLDNGSEEPGTLAYLRELAQDPRVRVLRDDAPFNYSRLNNRGAEAAQGELLALLNNDLRILRSDWLREMVAHALRPEVGAVGTKLYFANETIQHAGVGVGLGGMAGHQFKYLPRPMPGYHWWPFVTRQVSAVTAACLVTQRALFRELGGLDEKNLRVAFNDVDYCLRLGRAGYRVVFTPHAEMYHLESASRGVDTTLRKFLRLQSELRHMRKHWQREIDYDPAYNPNLTVAYEDFSLAWPPRAPENPHELRTT